MDKDVGPKSDATTRSISPSSHAESAVFEFSEPASLRSLAKSNRSVEAEREAADANPGSGRTPRRKQCKSTCGLCADVWEQIGESWEVTHRFNTGLELDRLGTVPLDSRHSRVHLPMASIHALEILRSALRRPKAVALDVKIRDEEQDGCPTLCKALLLQVSEHLSTAGRIQAEALLRSRTRGIRPVKESSPLPPLIGHEGDSDAESSSSEVLMEPAMGMEALDVSVCLLPELDAAEPPLIAFSRLDNPVRPPGVQTSGTVRYALLVVCSSANGASARLGNQVARSFATAMMDEEFYRDVRSCKDADKLYEAFDAYLGSLTIVPTVYINSSPGTDDPQGTLADYLLSDSLVNGIQRIIARVRNLQKPEDKLKLHHQRKRGDEHVVELRRKFFVEVNELTSSVNLWRVTHRLRQGLELDVMCSMRRPHLPRVSISALAHVRRLMTPASVALDVVATSPQEGIDSTVCQLGQAGLPQAAVDHITDALLQRAFSDAYAMGGTNENDEDTGVKRARDIDCGELMQPYMTDEAIHVLVVSSKHIPASHGIVGAFMRFASPLGVHFASFETPIRFLLVFAGPQKSEGLLAALGDSLAALTIDEDLMGDLSRATDVESFTAAVDNCLNDLVVFPHAHVQASIHEAFGRSPRSPQPRMKEEQESKAISKPSSLEPPADKEKCDAPEEPAVNATARVHTSTQSLESFVSMYEEEPVSEAPWQKARHVFKRVIGVALKYSLPLVSGVIVALAWCNIDEHSYHDFTHGQLWKDAEILGHELSLHFVVNDIFMCFFFGLAIKEVTEALLPGGSLSPLWRAANPLCATVGGVVGPIAVYIVAVLIFDAMGLFDRTMCLNDVGEGDGAHRLLRALVAQATETPKESRCDLSVLIKGWGVPTATDISLAWMFALLVFGAGHPTINFLLLLAIVDDAIGMIIIAVAYPNPEMPVEPVWLLLVLAGILVAMGMRYFSFRSWQAYIFIAGPISWFGLLKAHVHPALALSVVVPFMPANHARPKAKQSERKISVQLEVIGGKLSGALGAITGFRRGNSTDLGALTSEVADTIGDVPEEKKKAAASRAAAILAEIRHAPLHEFEHKLKIPVDLGMFFFGLANAGVQLGSIGGITYSVVASLIIGKTLGIAGFGLLAVKLGFALPAGVSVVDLFAVSALGGIGLTVALFVANEAFVDPGLQGQAKMGAVISVASAGVAWAIKYFGDSAFPPDDEESIVESLSDNASEDEGEKEEEPDEKDKDEEDWIDEAVLDDILQTLWTQRRYEAHGTNLPLTQRSMSKRSSGIGSQESRKGSKMSYRTGSHQNPRPLREESIAVARSASKQSARRDNSPQAASLNAWMPAISRQTSKEKEVSPKLSVGSFGRKASSDMLGVTVEDDAIEQEIEEISPTASTEVQKSFKTTSPRSVT